MDFILIPRGNALLGMPRPAEPEHTYVVPSLGLSISILVLLFFCKTMSQKRVRVQFSLKELMVAFIGISLLVFSLFGIRSATHEREAFESLDEVYRNAFPEELPQRQFDLNYELYLSKYEVTNGLWDAVCGEFAKDAKHPSSAPPNVAALEKIDQQSSRKNFPVTGKSELEIEAFIQILSKLTGKRYRLPTESEWQFACNGGALGFYSSGFTADDLAMVGWFDGNSNGELHEVGKLAPNTFGLFDMHGNASEVCLSDENNGQLFARGGSYVSVPQRCRTSARQEKRYFRAAWQGFRLAFDPNKPIEPSHGPTQKSSINEDSNPPQPPPAPK